MLKVKEEHRSLLIIAGLLLAVYLLFDFLLILFVSFLLITAFLPLVRFLQAKKIPRILSSVILVVTILAIPIILLFSLGPAIAAQTRSMIEEAPQLLETLEDRTGLAFSSELADDLRGQLSNAGGYLFNLTTTVLTALVSFVIVLVLTVYGLVFYDGTRRAVITFFARNSQQKRNYQALLSKLEDRVGTWVKGQLFLSLFIGLVSWVAYLLLGLPFAGTLAILAGVFELLPGIGPTLAAIPALIIALTVSPQTFVLTLVAYLFIQTLESYVVTPRVMSRVIKLNPFITILIVLTGTFLLGIIGAFLAIPFALFLGEIYKHLSSPAAKTSK